jgi:hypothetical protein
MTFSTARLFTTITATFLAAILAAQAGLAQDAKPSSKTKGTRFWNLTGETVTKFELAPAGTLNFGPDQAKNDKDGTVDNDERLKLIGVADGKYDARITDKAGRVCLASGLEIKADAIVSVEKDQLKNCKP